MTYEDFLKTFIEENKDKVTRDRMFGGYDISKYDGDKLTNKCYEFISDKMNAEFPIPNIDSEEYHNYYRNMMVMKAFCNAFQKYADNHLMYLPKPPSTEDFSVYINKKTKDVLTYWFRIRRTTNLKDSQGNVVCIDDELVDISNGHKCWLLSDYDGLYIRYDYWLSLAKGRPDIIDVQDLFKFTITKRHSIF